MRSVLHVRIGSEDWRRLGREIERIAAGGVINVVMSMSFRVEDDHEDLHELAKRMEGLGVSVDEHIHGDHASISIAMDSPGNEFISRFRKLIDLVKECDCSLSGIDGEIHLDGDVGAIFFGDGYKLTFILPHQDGRRLIIMELGLMSMGI